MTEPSQHSMNPLLLTAFSKSSRELHVFPLRLVFVISTMTLLVIYTIFAINDWYAVQRDETKSLRYINQLFAKTSERLLNQRYALLQTIGERLLELQAFDNPQEAELYLNYIKHININALGFILTDPHGKIRFFFNQYKEGIEPPPKVVKWLQNPPKISNGIDALPPLYHPTIGRWIIPFRMAIRDAQGHINAWIAMGYQIDDEKPLIWRDLDLPKGIDILVLRDDGYWQFSAFQPKSIWQELYTHPVSDALMQKVRHHVKTQTPFEFEFQGKLWMGMSRKFQHDGFYALTIHPKQSLWGLWWKRNQITFFLMLFAILETWLTYRLAFRIYTKVERSRVETERQFQFLAEHDTLTGLPNRFYTLHLLSKALRESQQNKEGMALLYIDLDHFKQVNDAFGHLTGDRLLRSFAKAAQEWVQDKGELCHLSGDEFLLIMPFKHRDEVEILAEDLKAKTFEKRWLGYRNIHVSLSIGISLYPQDSTSQDDLLQYSDIALYAAKIAGKNRIQFFEPAFSQKLFRKMRLIRDLRKALIQSEITVHYQCIYHLSSRYPRSMEALARWQHPELGMISPGEFIPLAEESGLIHELGALVLRQACLDRLAIDRKDLQNFRVAVNVSVKQLQEPHFDQLVLDILKETGLEPHKLELEITESIFAGDLKIIRENLKHLAQHGIEITLNDFGTGYSSLGYLNRFPISNLKIDRSFVQNVLDNQSDAVMTEAIVALGHVLNLSIIAEGIEREDQLAFLRQCQCDAVQGFLLAKPRPITRETQKPFCKS